MEQGSENGLIILTDGALTKPTQNAEDTEEGCTCWKRGAFPSCQPSGAWQVPHWPLQPRCFPVLGAGTNPFCHLEHSLPPSPFNPPVLQHLKGSSESFLCKFNWFFLMQKHVKAKQNKKQALLIRAV